MADPNNNEVYTEFVGCMEKRNVQKFKRLLREKGAVFEVENNFGLEERDRLNRLVSRLCNEIVEERRKKAAKKICISELIDTSFQNAVDDEQKYFIKKLVEVIDSNVISIENIQEVKIRNVSNRGYTDYFIISISHKEKPKYEILIEVINTEFIISFVGIIQIFGEYGNYKQRSDDAINYIKEILTSEIELHTFYKAEKITEVYMYLNKVGERKLVRSPLYINLPLFNPFLKKREIIETISF